MKKNMVIIILVVLVVGLGCTLGYVLLNKENNTENKTKNIQETSSEKESLTDKENTTENEIENAQEISSEGENLTDKDNVVVTRMCVGVYSGAVSGAHSPGTLTVELKSNGAYLVDGYETGTYKIIDNALLLITAPDTCGPGQTCQASYDLGTISDDCNTMYWPYQNNKFEFTKQN